MPAPGLNVDDLSVVGEPDARARHADRRVAIVVVEMVGRRNPRSHDNRAAVFLQAGAVEDGEIEVLVAVAGGFDHGDAFGGGRHDRREDVAPVLHGDVLAVRSRRLQLDQDDVAGLERAGRVGDGAGGVEHTVHARRSGPPPWRHG